MASTHFFLNDACAFTIDMASESRGDMKEDLVFTIGLLASELRRTKAKLRSIRELRGRDSKSFIYELTKLGDELASVKAERDRLKEDLNSSYRLIDVHRAEYQKLIKKYEDLIK